jgi:phenylacetate-CoA ligase
MRRMERVTGRSDDMIVVRGVNVFPTQIEEQILRCEGLAPHFLIELRRDQRLDDMRIIAEARQSHADQAARDTQGKLLASYIRTVIGLRAEVVVDEPGKIERSTGKAKRIIDLRPK